MSKTLFVLVSFMALVACGGGAPPGPFPDSAGDRVIFVNYWAEWCKPCREEIPELNDFQREYAAEIALFGVNFDGVSGEDLAAQERALGIAFPTLAEDPGPALGWPVPEGLPYTMVTDRAGTRLIQLPGKQTAESLREALARFRLPVEEES